MRLVTRTELVKLVESIQKESHDSAIITIQYKEEYGGRNIVFEGEDVFVSKREHIKHILHNDNYLFVLIGIYNIINKETHINERRSYQALTNSNGDIELEEHEPSEYYSKTL